MKTNRKLLTILAFGIIFLDVFTACQKNDLPPSSYGDPVLFLSGKFYNNTVSFTIDNSSNIAVPSVIDDSLTRIRVFDFSVNKNANPVGPKADLSLSFINYKTPYSEVNTDLDSTFKPGSKVPGTIFPPQTNPEQLNTFKLDFKINDTAYTSYLFNNINPGTCNIDSVKNLTWLDGITYKMIYLSLSCEMMIDSSVNIPFTEGKAVIAFPKK